MNEKSEETVQLYSVAFASFVREFNRLFEPEAHAEADGDYLGITIGTVTMHVHMSVSLACVGAEGKGPDA